MRWLKKASLLLLIPLLVSCGGGGGLIQPKGFDQYWAQSEFLVHRLADSVNEQTDKEKASRAACASGDTKNCKPPTYYMSHDRAIGILDWLGTVKDAVRLAKAGKNTSCVQGASLSALGLSGCVNSITVLQAAIASLNAIETRLGD